MRNIKVAIPLKTNSERVPNKNLRPFYNGKSLFDIKANQLLKVFKPEDVLVSSENPAVEELTSKYGFKFHLRDVSLTKSTARENQIVKTITDAIEDKECDIMWAQVTQPLFNELDKNGNPVNFNFGYWHKVSQDLPTLYEVTWSAFIMKREMLNEAYYQIGRSPLLYETHAPLVDINNQTEFEVAQILYAHYENLKQQVTM